MNTNLVTICIPIYNASSYLDDAISSVINQTYRNWKLYLINDGSTDNSLEIAKKYINDERIIVVNDGENMGLIYRLNQSIRLTHTKYYARMDADDIMHPERLELQLSIMEENIEIDILGSNAYSIDVNNNIIAVRNPISNTIEDCANFIHPSIIAKTSWLKNNNYSDVANRVEDMELWHRTYNKSVFKRINLPLLYYREFGFVYYPKYRKSILSQLKLSIASCKLNDGNSFFWLRNTLTTTVKYIIYRSFALLKKEDFLIKRRNVTLDECNKSKAYQNLLLATKKIQKDRYEK